MTRSKTAESLVSALVILFIALVLILARGHAHGWPMNEPSGQTSEWTSASPAAESA